MPAWRGLRLRGLACGRFLVGALGLPGCLLHGLAGLAADFLRLHKGARPGGTLRRLGHTLRRGRGARHGGALGVFGLG